MNHTEIIIKNAKTHNLKNISVDVPKNKVVVFTGVSGSGKSSLVFDTIYTEAQRQLIETFSSFARARMPKLTRPDVEEIKNISTTIVIDQKRMGTTLRSTVGTATELYTYLRLLFSRCGDKFIGPSFFFGFNHPLGMCPDCKGLGKRITIDASQLLDRDLSIKEGAIQHPDYKVGGWLWRELMVMNLFDTEKKIKDFSETELNKLLFSNSIPIEKAHGAGTYSKIFEGLTIRLERLNLNKSEDELSEERKNAYQKYFIYSDCSSCNGARINENARSVKVAGKSIPDLINIELTELYEFLNGIEGAVARPMVTKMKQILFHLIEIGVGYLSLNRSVATLSGGESQRVKMARQLDCDLVDLIYILDEPSIGLHPKDSSKLIDILKQLRDKGNSVLVVEHDPDIIKCADHVIDVGPKAGALGGEIVYSGTVEGLKDSKGLTGQFLNKPATRFGERKTSNDYFEIHDANMHNLKNISTRIPKGVLTCITGVAGSGKSTLINDVFVKDHKESVIIDQSPIGKSSRSNPATYIGFFDLVRKEFAKATNSDPSLFSFNSKGACPKCKGLGTINYEMSFLDEVKVICDECQGQRYTDNVLALTYNGKNIFDVLNTTAVELIDFFNDKETTRRINVLCDVGLEYLEIGQPLSTLSGGESQRIKLASELHKKGNIYIMDEPTTGLHMADIEKLIKIIKRLVSKNNSVIVIEHNLDVIKHADWVIDLGPDGGSKGGYVLFEGTPENLITCENSYTGYYLNKYLNN